MDEKSPKKGGIKVQIEIGKCKWKVTKKGKEIPKTKMQWKLGSMKDYYNIQTNISTISCQALFQ